MNFEFVVVLQKKQMTNQNEDNFEEVKSFLHFITLEHHMFDHWKFNYEDSLQCWKQCQFKY